MAPLNPEAQSFAYLYDRVEVAQLERMFANLSSARFIRPIGVLALLGAILLSVYVLSGNSVPYKIIDALPGAQSESSAELDDKETFIRAFLGSEIDGPWDPKPIQKLCADTKWEEGLTFVCEAPQGGVGNVRNVFLNCVRYAIQAGATNFIIPKIIARDQKDLSKLTTKNIVPFEYMFDVRHFKAAMYFACPQITILDELPPNSAAPVPLSVEKLLPESHFAGFVVADPQDWRAAFDTWMDGQEKRPKVVSVGTPLLNWPIWYDESALRASFGRILQFNKATRRLAGSVLWRMRMEHNLPIKPWDIKRSGFLGAHLRVAEDAVKAGWMSYEEQSAWHWKYAKEIGLETVYVTSESEPAKKFKEDGVTKGFNVTSKDDLLDAAELKELESMSWDQRALVDYQVLLRGQAFGGIDTSSFSWNIALRRHLLVPGRAGKGWTWKDMANAGWEGGEGLNAKDSISRVLGEGLRYDMFKQAMWP